MEEGAYVWCSANKGDEAWILSEVLKKGDDKLELQQVDKKDNVFTRLPEEQEEESAVRKFQGVELANARLSAADEAEGLDNDLIALPHLHEPAILHAISERFFRGKIYTWTGPVLIAVNPFQRLPLYTDAILDSYRSEGLFRSQGMGNAKSDLEPHVFAVADRSYRQMMSDQRKSQSILISGESGAGKTESTKIVMSYLTTLGGMGVEQDDSGELSVMERVLQSNPVLEAFGNARTLRNDNSSRFGKFIELGFSRAGHLLGAKVQTYLLEKVRIAFHGTGERNYHIFYQLLRGATEEQKAKYFLDDEDTGGVELSNHFYYTKQGGAPQLREFTDEAGLEYTLKAMRALLWTEETIDGVLALIAGVLHLGEISFRSKESDSGQEAAEVENVKSMERAASLLGVDVAGMTVALTEKVLVTRGEEIRKELTPESATDARDALSKTIYGALFLWVVDQVNQSICWKNDGDVRSSVGVLDIFGFECFSTNSFEQLCINFTNEALQQQFNKFIFKLEQAEYESEQIEWAFISFPDNQDCLDTIQKSKVGILSMLDDECRLPRGSDRNWAKRMFQQWLPNKDQFVSDNTRFHATKIQQAKALFCVRHFAGLVEYTAETNFMEKNKDEIPLAAQNLFESAPSQLIKNVYSIQKRETDDGSKQSSSSGKSKTVGQQFKAQLVSLVASVEKTDPHYIRCLKPNDAAKPRMLTRKRLTEQLRYGGVLEAVRVARAGYPVRLTHQSFFQRYRMLLPSIPDAQIPWSMEGQDAQKLCVSLLVACLEEGKKQEQAKAEGTVDPSEPGISRVEKIRRMQNQPIPMIFPQTDVQLGLTKVFMRKPPHDALEAHRVFHQHVSAMMIQCWVRGLQQRKKYLIIDDCVQTVQRCYRGYKGRERWWRLRKASAGLLLTTHYRMQIHRRKYNRGKKGTIQFQALFKGCVARRVLASVKVQKHYRMYRRRKNFRMLKSATVSLQCIMRTRIATKYLRSLMGEQKDIGKLKQNNERLKMEMNSLKAMLAAQAKEDASNVVHQQELEAKQVEIDKLEKRVAELERQLSDEKALIKKLEENLRQSKEFAAQQQQTPYEKRNDTVASPRTPGRKSHASPAPTSLAHPISSDSDVMSQLSLPNLPTNFASPEALAQHKASVAKLEAQLKMEKKQRRMADAEIIKLRAQVNGVELKDSDLAGLLVDESSEAALSGETPEVTGSEADLGKSILGSMAEGIASAFSPKNASIEEEKKEKEPSRFSMRILPKIRRGLGGESKEEEIVSSGWKTEIKSRKDREENLRDSVHHFEGHMDKFIHSLEDGFDVVMWQMNRSAEDKHAPSEFPLKASHVTIKMQRNGDLYVQAVLNFILRGGYLSKTIGRNRGVNKSALEPVSLRDILEVRAGCSGYDHTELPSAAGRSKSKGKSKSENRQGNLFITITATPTPMAASRSYILRFKSRSARNEVMNGLRSVLADMQIHEGVSVSNLHTDQNLDDDSDVVVPLGAVHNVLNKEREAYDRILLLFLQSTEDVKSQEDSLTKMRSKFESILEESAEKDRVQANDSKLIMQLSKKLETLLMDNEDLRDQNDRLNTRLIAAECEKMNMM